MQFDNVMPVKRYIENGANMLDFFAEKVDKTLEGLPITVVSFNRVPINLLIAYRREQDSYRGGGNDVNLDIYPETDRASYVGLEKIGRLWRHRAIMVPAGFLGELQPCMRVHDRRTTIYVNLFNAPRVGKLSHATQSPQ